ncbi:Got1/Sft2-like vescicle transport protein family [Striga hermonthica]|uniref:Got1/Sft2-like vescicle transport protein family n=1 Tax=Striga hermonthica TaxID=68872 RepID=A0A9N7MXK1_STRHE|nr:Got1/Sft2-like vescicle transport protein family [Striga hermonthica]
MMQNWFSGGAGDNEKSLQTTPFSSSPSLLADWNSYSAARSSEESSSAASFAGVFDIESAVRSANDTVSGTFNVSQVDDEQWEFV